MKIISASCKILTLILSTFPGILIAKPGPGKGCLKTIYLDNLRLSPIFLTSSLNNSLNGSTNLNFIFFGKPPTL